ncbi:MAG: AraC family transcriptional regulator [Nevskiaceae bacterium]|nr:MAG: AraC family transcriptional regulator [Nevskiaceae bacterium]TBR73619.1 MAG: AraC family transcriptional regulator [Nevskiaceae bacterium]
MRVQPATLHPVVISQVIVNFAAQHGVSAATCLRGTRITETRLRDPNEFITRDQEIRLIENLMRTLPEIPALGFELGLQYKVATFGIWGFAVRISQNLREAFQCALRYLPLSTAYCRFAIAIDEREFALVADPTPIPPSLRTFLLQRDTATAINLVRELGLSGVDVLRLEYTGAAPGHAERIRALCGLAPIFGSPRNAIVMRRQDVEIPLPMYDAQLAGFLDNQCRSQLARRQNTGITGQVRQAVLGPLGLIASFEDVAKQLALAPRTLRRKLEEEGATYRSLIDEERKQLSAHLLTQTDMKLDVVALQTGYTDAPSFARAFRRWFDQAPGEYRTAHRP